MPIINLVYEGKPSKPATAISLNQSSITLTTVGQTSQLTATLTPSDSTSTVTWSSSNTSIATVSQSGLVTCVTPGSCTITATTDNGLTATCSVQSILTTTDYVVNQTYSYRGSDRSRWYGVKFTALKSGSIKEVGLYYIMSGAIKIAQGNYASVSGTEYNFDQSDNITISTPYQITAGNNYVVSFKIAYSYFYAYSGTGILPATRTAVRYDYYTNSSSTSTGTDMAYIKYLKIDYTP